MTPNQDEFASIVDACLELVLTGQATADEILLKYPEYADELRPVMDTVLWFGKHKQVFDPPPELKSTQKLLLQKNVSPLLQKSQTPFFLGKLIKQLTIPFTRRTLQIAGSLALVLILIISSSAGIVLAASNSIPGDLLYKSKLSIEKAALFLSLSETRDVELEVEFTNRRMVEVVAVIQENRLGYLTASVERFSQQVDRALNEIDATPLPDLSEKARLAIKVEGILESHSAQISAFARTLPEVYQADMSLALTITQDSLSRAARIIDQPDRIPDSSSDPTTGIPLSIWTSTPSLTTLPDENANDAGSGVISASVTPTVSLTPTDLILPGTYSTPTPTSTPTLTNGELNDLPTFTPTRKPTKTPRPSKTPRPKPTRNPFYENESTD